MEYSVLVVLSSIIPVIFFVCILVIPDSPYSLIALGRTTEAKAALVWLRRVPWPEVENEYKEMEVSYHIYLCRLNAIRGIGRRFIFLVRPSMIKLMFPISFIFPICTY